MTNDFHSYNGIYNVYDRENENHWSLLITWNANTCLNLNVTWSVILCCHAIVQSPNKNGQ